MTDGAFKVVEAVTRRAADRVRELEADNNNLRATLRRVIQISRDEYLIEVCKHALGEGPDPRNK